MSSASAGEAMSLAAIQSILDRRELIDAHVAELAHSGITRDKAIAEGIRSVTDPKLIARILGWNRPAKKLGPCLMFAFRDVNGVLLAEYARLKPTCPRLDKEGDRKGRLIKYESPMGMPNRVYIPLGALAAVAAPAAELFLTEGEKKSLKATHEGFPTIGLVGVWGWQEKRPRNFDGHPTGERRLIPDLAAISWAGRRVVIVFDSDAVRKPDVLAAETALADLLVAHGADVRVIRLPEPSQSDGTLQKCGLDDYLIANSAESLQVLINGTPSHVRTPPNAVGPPPGRRLVEGNHLTDSGYAVLGGNTYHCTLTTDDGDNLKIQRRMKLANFSARIIGETIVDDGAEPARHLQIEIQQPKRAVVSAMVPIERWVGLDWIVETFGPRHIIQPGNGKRDHLRCAIQELSGDELVTRTIYTHTGWRKIEGRWNYLHAGGGLVPSVPSVPVSGIDVRLAGAMERYRFPPAPTGEALISAVRSSLGILNGLAPDPVAFSLLAITYRAGLDSPDFSGWLAGPTGAQKSELAALGQQHFGAEMVRIKLPGNWSSTDNALEGMAFSVKDALFVIDDFAPPTSRGDSDRQQRAAERLIRGQGNHSGRQRMRQDSTLRPAKPPRGLILATGEDVPRGHSIAARLWIIEVKKGDVNKARLTECQRDAANGQYAAAMAGFLSWLASQYDDILLRLGEERAECRDRLVGRYPHVRMPDTIANLLLGLRYFLRFAEYVGAISSLEHQQLWQRGMDALHAVAGRQGEHQRAVDPVSRFPELLASVIASGRGHIAGADGDEPGLPPGPTAWGWEGREFRSGPEAVGINYVGRGKKIGWVKGEELYLEPDSTYAAICELTREQGGTYPVAQQTLCNRLREAGHVLRYESGRNTYPITLEGVRRRVLIFSTSILLDAPSPSVQPGQTGQTGHTQVIPSDSGHNQRPGSPATGEKPGQRSGTLPDTSPVSFPEVVTVNQLPGREFGHMNVEKTGSVPVVPVSCAMGADVACSDPRGELDTEGEL